MNCKLSKLGQTASALAFITALMAPHAVIADTQSAEALRADALRQATLDQRAEVDEKERAIALARLQADLAEQTLRGERAISDAEIAKMEAEKAKDELIEATRPKVDAVGRDEVVSLIRGETESLRNSIDSLARRTEDGPSFRSVSNSSGAPEVKWLGLVGRSAGMFDISGATVTLRMGETQEGVTLSELGPDRAVTVHAGQRTTHRLAR